MKRYLAAVGREVRALWRLSMRTLANTITASPSERWQRVECFHHDHKARTVYGIDPAKADAGRSIVTGTVSGNSWIKTELIDLGRNKMWYCTKCHQVWFLV
jgi:hypothetical protein